MPRRQWYGRCSTEEEGESGVLLILKSVVAEEREGCCPDDIPRADWGSLLGPAAAMLAHTALCCFGTSVKAARPAPTFSRQDKRQFEFSQQQQQAERA